MDINKEKFFHFLWRNIHFDQHKLQSTQQSNIAIIDPGFQNFGDGPDFRFAQIRIGDIIFFGDIELHKTASEWYKHGHHNDVRYNQVILHVVIFDDLHKRNIRTADGASPPTLEIGINLPNRLAKLWRAFQAPELLPCSSFINEIPGSTFEKIMDKWDQAYFRYRLDKMLTLYNANKTMSKAWFEMLVKGVFQGLGYHKNQQNMLTLADFVNRRNTFYKKWAIKVPGCSASEFKRQKNVTDLANTLIWHAGLHNNTEPKNRRQQTHNKPLLHRSDWNFSTSRPANQPRTRIKQAAGVYLRLQELKIRKWLEMSPDLLWNDLCKYNDTPNIGKNRRDIIFFNVIIPAVYLLSHWLHCHKQRKRTTELWLSQHIPLPPKTRHILIESNFQTGKHLSKLATWHQFKYFCQTRRCDECAVMKYFAQAKHLT